MPNIETINNFFGILLVSIVTFILLVVTIISKEKITSADASGLVVGGNNSNDENIDRIISGLKYGIPIEKLLPRKLSLESQEKFNNYFQPYYSLNKLKATMTLDDINQSIKYVNNHIPNINVHMGQRKLFLSELQFLVDNAYSTVSSVVVYAGAAPGNHTKFLASLFPNIKFILVDPAKFIVKGEYLQTVDDHPMDLARTKEIVKTAMKGTKQIYIINDFFTSILAEELREYSILFISDIRTNSDASEFPKDSDLVWNYAQQYIWIKLMNPIMAMTKFRHPFYLTKNPEYTELMLTDLKIAKDLGIDFADNFNKKKLVFFDGVINLQAFAGKNSTETRLVTDCRKLRDYSGPEEYEAKLFYYNKIERGFIKHENSNADKQIGFDYCNDCAIENYLWMQYIQKYTSNLSVKELVLLLCKNSNGSLLFDTHGKFFIKHDFYNLLLKRKNKEY